jgi:polysaccharide biosynthesis/export protein
MKRLLYLLAFVLFASGCRVFAPSQMLRLGDYPISEFSDSLKRQEYVIAPNDVLQINMTSKDGESLLAGGGEGASSGLSYTVEYDGQIKLPILNRTPIAGKTLREAEKMLEEIYSPYFNEPFVQLKVSNKRVILFFGGQESHSSVVLLNSDNTTLFEVMAQSGGVQGGKAHNIKLIRGDLKNPKIYKIDLSTIKGMTEADMVLQANDIIYIEPRNQISQKIVGAIAPYLTLFSTFLAVYAIFKR